MPDCSNDMAASTTPCTNTVPVHEPVPSSPPPSYEHVLAETRLQAAAAAAAAAAEVDSMLQPDSRTTIEEQKVVVVLPDADEPDNNDVGLEVNEEDDDEGGGEEGGGNQETSTVAAPSPKRPEILHKSSKELYRAVAAQWGITCKMSDHCRCLDCQSRYFDCEYDQNEQEKTDGGLGAGTPMFISEVMHGSACNIL